MNPLLGQKVVTSSPRQKVQFKTKYAVSSCPYIQTCVLFSFFFRVNKYVFLVILLLNILAYLGLSSCFMNMGKLKCIFELDLTEDKPTESWYPTRAKGCPQKKRKTKEKIWAQGGLQGFFFLCHYKKKQNHGFRNQ